MPRLLRNALTAAKVRNAGPGEYADGNGLALRVSASGARSWVQRLRVHGRAANLGLGSATLVTLADARRIAADNRAIARTGGDPRKAKVPTFGVVASDCFARLAQNWKGGADSKTARDWHGRMDQYIAPKLGAVPVDQVGTAAIDDVLRPLAEAGQQPTARRVGEAITAVLRHATLREHCEPGRDNAVGIVLASLPKRATAVQHHAALDHAEVAEALRSVESSQSLAKLAVRFTALTAARQIETRRATWDQIDFDAATWTVPAENMKGNREHRVPLAGQAVAVLRAAKARNGSRYIFHGRDGGMLGQNSIGAALRNAGIDASGHGFRSSFKGWARDTSVDELLSEFALAHVEGSATVAAYARSDQLEQRRPIMQAWADHVAP